VDLNRTSKFFYHPQLQVRLLLIACLGGISLAGCTNLHKPEDHQQSSMPLMQKPFDLQGHRGARGLRPENTIPAFIYALELGVDTLEMDVVINAEGQVVLSHEPWMSALICSHPGGRAVRADEERNLNIYHMSQAQLASFDCGSRRHPDFPQQQSQATSKPLLADVFTAVKNHEASNSRPPVRFNIEIKSRLEFDGIYHPPVEEFALALYRDVKEHELLDRTSIQSFDPRALEALHRIDPDAETVWLISNQLSLAENLARLSFKPDIYSPDYRLVGKVMVEQLRALYIKLIPWTVNEPEDMRRLMDLGVDGLITDYPDRALDLMRMLSKETEIP
jgi:glycerophosphoryl diester phosphodiesterase